MSNYALFIEKVENVPEHPNMACLFNTFLSFHLFNFMQRSNFPDAACYYRLLITCINCASNLPLGNTYESILYEPYSNETKIYGCNIQEMLYFQTDPSVDVKILIELVLTCMSFLLPLNISLSPTFSQQILVKDPVNCILSELTIAWTQIRLTDRSEMPDLSYFKRKNLYDKMSRTQLLAGSPCVLVTPGESPSLTMFVLIFSK